MCGRLCLYVYQALIKWFYDAFIDKIKNIGTVLLNILLHDLGKDGSSYFQITECWDEEWICWMSLKDRSIHPCCPYLTMSPPPPDSGMCLPIPTRLQRQSSLVVPNFWTQTQSGSTLYLATQKTCAHTHNKKVSEAIFCFINHATFYFIFIPILF